MGLPFPDSVFPPEEVATPRGLPSSQAPAARTSLADNPAPASAPATAPEDLPEVGYMTLGPEAGPGLGEAAIMTFSELRTAPHTSTAPSLLLSALPQGFLPW